MTVGAEGVSIVVVVLLVTASLTYDGSTRVTHDR